MSDHTPSPEDPIPIDNDDNLAITVERVVEVLEKGDVSTEHGAIQWSSNYTFLTSVCHDDIDIMAVYKPKRGERPLWDFPDGTLCNRERAAYLTSEALEWRIVPPTILRDGPRGYGSFQFYIDHDPNFTYFNFDESFLPQLMRLSVFDYLVNNADRKGGHCIVDAQEHVWGIDHGITFHSSNKLRTVIWNFSGEIIPDMLLQDVTKLCTLLQADSPFRRELESLLHPAEVKAFMRRIDRTLESKTFPVPGPGPNYPWPPV